MRSGELMIEVMVKEITRDGAKSTVDIDYLDMDDFDPNMIVSLHVTDEEAVEMIRYCEDVVKTVNMKAYEYKPGEPSSGLVFFGYPHRGKVLASKLRDLLRHILKALNAGMSI